MPPRGGIRGGRRGGARGGQGQPNIPNTSIAEAPVNSASSLAPLEADIVIPKPIPLPEVEDFGRDENLKTLLKSLLPKFFNGEGADVPKVLDEWMQSMDDYFHLACYNDPAKSILGQAKLEGSAKSWWKVDCANRGVRPGMQTWEELKLRMKERYLPLNFRTLKMNEFLACSRKNRPVDAYYEEFVKLSKHAPALTEEEKLSRFVLGLEGNLTDEVEALRPITLADALIRAKAKISSAQKVSLLGDKRKAPDFPPNRAASSNPGYRNPCPNQTPAAGFIWQQVRKPNPIQLNAVTPTRSPRDVRCFGCSEWGHLRSACPYLNHNPQNFPPPPQITHQTSPFIPSVNPRPMNPPQIQYRTPLPSLGPLSSQSLVYQTAQQNYLPAAPNNHPNRGRGGRNGRGSRGGRSTPIPQAQTNNSAGVKAITLGEEIEERAEVFAALDSSGKNRQFSVIETPVQSMGPILAGTRGYPGDKGEEPA